jgi:hypothetical protein
LPFKGVVGVPHREKSGIPAAGFIKNGFAIA